MSRYLICSDIHLNVNRRFDDTIVALNQVSQIATKEKVNKILILGDTFNSRRPHSKELSAFERWASNLIGGTELEIVVIRGNHDEFPDGTHSYHSFEELGYTKVRIYSQPHIEDGIFMGHMLLREAKIGPTDYKLKQELSVDELITKYPNCACYLLGDVHKPQTIQENPLVIYAGSIVPVDFGERDDIKRVILLDTVFDYPNEKFKIANWRSIPLTTRLMSQVDVYINDGQVRFDYEPIALPATTYADALVKVIIHGTKIDLAKTDESKVREAFAGAKELYVEYDIENIERSRDPNVNETISAEQALEEYLKKQNLGERSQLILDLGRELITRIKENAA